MDKETHVQDIEKASCDLMDAISAARKAHKLLPSYQDAEDLYKYAEIQVLQSQLLAIRAVEWYDN